MCNYINGYIAHYILYYVLSYVTDFTATQKDILIQRDSALSY